MLPAPAVPGYLGKLIDDAAKTRAAARSKIKSILAEHQCDITESGKLTSRGAAYIGRRFGLSARYVLALANEKEKPARPCGIELSAIQEQRAYENFVSEYKEGMELPFVADEDVDDVAMCRKSFLGFSGER